MKTALKALRDVGGQAITIICVETVLLALIVMFSLEYFLNV